MTTDDLIDEGLDYLRAFPNAKATQVRRHLEDYVVGNAPDGRTSMDAMRYGIPELVNLFRRAWHRGRIDRAMKELFPDEKPRKGKTGRGGITW